LCCPKTVLVKYNYYDMDNLPNRPNDYKYLSMYIKNTLKIEYTNIRFTYYLKWVWMVAPDGCHGDWWWPLEPWQHVVWHYYNTHSNIHYKFWKNKLFIAGGWCHVIKWMGLFTTDCWRFCLELTFIIFVKNYCYMNTF